MSAAEAMKSALAECQLHADVLAEALAELMPVQFTPETASSLGKDQRRLLDQLAYRFAKLQDTLGERVLPQLLDLAQEPLSEAATFAEKLQRLERLRAIESAGQWRELRELRNQIAHEYFDQPEVRAAILNRFLEGVGQLLTTWRQVVAYAESISAAP